jgi:putative tricarboxylic transport membrane protein
MILFGVVGYFMKKFDYDGAPLVLAMVIGPLLENKLRKALIISRGNFSVFFLRPISAVCLILALFLLISPFLPWIAKKRGEIPKEEIA